MIKYTIAEFLRKKYTEDQLNEKLSKEGFACEFFVELRQDWEKGITTVIFCDASCLIFSFDNIVARNCSGLKFLDQNAYYMNPLTGSVDLGRNWEEDFESCDFSEENWINWGGPELVEVIKNENGDWVEVK